MKKIKKSIQSNAIIVSHFWENLNRVISKILMRKISMITKHFGKLLNPFYRKGNINKQNDINR